MIRKLLYFPLFFVLLTADAFAASKADIDAALNEWKTAVESSNADDIMKLYDQNAIMISTFVQNPMVKRSDIAAYYKKVVANPDVHVEIQETHPRIIGSTAINTGRYTLSYTQDGEEVSIPARFSFTYVRRDDKWLIVDHHSSRVPLPEEKH